MVFPFFFFTSMDLFGFYSVSWRVTALSVLVLPDVLML
jgi:hypothetical protein